MSQEIIKLPKAAALISFRRAQGHVNLYGSSFEHQGFVRIDIRGAREIQEAGIVSRMGDREKHQITVQMSFAQYAEAITSMNVGDGIPCTITRLNGMPVGPIQAAEEKIESFKAVGNKAAEQSLVEINLAIAEVNAIKLPREAKNKILRSLHQAEVRLSDSLPYIVECFNEELELLNQQARIEVSAYVDMALHQAGINNQPLLQMSNLQTDKALDQFEQFEQAQQLGNTLAETELRAVDTWYSTEIEHIFIRLNNRALMGFPYYLLEGVQYSTPQQRAEVKLTPTGSGLHWESLDVDLSISQLVAGVFGSKKWMDNLTNA